MTDKTALITSKSTCRDLGTQVKSDWARKTSVQMIQQVVNNISARLLKPLYLEGKPPEMLVKAFTLTINIQMSLSTSNQHHLVTSDSNATFHLLSCVVCAQELKAAFSLTPEQGNKRGPHSGQLAPKPQQRTSSPYLKTEPHPHHDSYSPNETYTQTCTYIHKYTSRHKQA